MGRNMGGWVKKRSKIKRSSKTIDIVSYALKVSENRVTRVFVVHFRSSDTFKSLYTGLTDVSTKTCVTGNNLILHKALHVMTESLLPTGRTTLCLKQAYLVQCVHQSIDKESKLDLSN